MVGCLVQLAHSPTTLIGKNFSKSPFFQFKGFLMKNLPPSLL